MFLPARLKIIVKDKVKRNLIFIFLILFLLPITLFAVYQHWELRKKAVSPDTSYPALTYPEDRWQRIWYDDAEDAGGEYLQGQKPDSYIELPMGAAGELQFDEQDNLIVQDHTWPRAWVINLDKDPSWLKPVSTTADPTQLWFYNQTPNVLKLFGQKDYKEISEDTVVLNKIHHAAGVTIDRSVTPNRIYAVDSGNNRILGFASLGYCQNNNSIKCTNDLDCPNSTCYIDGKKDADLVFGQPSNETGPELSGACNRDANLGIYKNPAVDTLCFIHTPEATNMGEYGMRHNLDVDLQGNLYVLDPHNNRVLRYNQPFSTDKSDGKGDTLPDFVIGQDDFNSGEINKGMGKTSRNNTSLYTSMGGFDHVSTRGVSVDYAGNVWVADTFNMRVLRFPPGSKEADLVLGQKDFFSINPEIHHQNLRKAPLDRMCTPTLAKVNPENGKLYVIDEFPGGFKARILVFTPEPTTGDFNNGMSAEKAIFANQDGTMASWPNQGGGNACADQHTEQSCKAASGCYWYCENPPSCNIGTCYYYFRTSGFGFNTLEEEYTNGVLWVNENRRTILIDNDGNILKVIGAKDKHSKGCDAAYLEHWCGRYLFQNFNLCWPGGSIGIDNANNIYLADEQFSRIARFALPYNLDNQGCVPYANGGLFAGTRANSTTPYGTAGSVGVFAFQNQLILKDHNRLLVWNDYLDKSMGAPADFVIDQTAAYDKDKNPFQLGASSFHVIDDKNRLWTTNAHGKIIIFQLPFASGALPLKNFLKLYWADDGQEINYGGYGVAFDKFNKKIWVNDATNNRILRVSNYDNFKDRLYVDMVIGQIDKDGTCCNQIKKPSGTCEVAWEANKNPKPNTICDPTHLSIDNYGNLYLVENNYECHGNARITMFEVQDLKDAQGMFPNISAKKVFVRKSLTEPGSCTPLINEPHSPVSIAFDSKNQMIIGNDGYYGNSEERHLKQLWFYDNPLQKTGNDLLGESPDEPNVQFNNNWAEGELAYGKSNKIHFASSRKIHLYCEGAYRFTVNSDDDSRVRLWIDDELKIDNWKKFNYGSNSTDVPLSAGDHNFRLDYYEEEGAANVSFSFSPLTPCVIPTPTNAPTLTPIPTPTPCYKTIIENVDTNSEFVAYNLSKTEAGYITFDFFDDKGKELFFIGGRVQPANDSNELFKRSYVPIKVDILSNIRAYFPNYKGYVVVESHKRVEYPNSTNPNNHGPPIAVDDHNDPSVFNPIGDKTVAAGDLLEFSILAEDPDDPSIPWGQLEYFLVSKPEGASFNPETRTFSWTPSLSDMGDHQVTFQVQDKQLDLTVGNIVQETITIKVTSPAPTSTPTPTPTLTSTPTITPTITPCLTPPMIPNSKAPQSTCKWVEGSLVYTCTWNPVERATGYTYWVIRSGAEVAVGTTTETSVTLTEEDGIEQGVSYNCQVTGYNECGSQPSGPHGPPTSCPPVPHSGINFYLRSAPWRVEVSGSPPPSDTHTAIFANSEKKPSYEVFFRTWNSDYHRGGTPFTINVDSKSVAVQSASLSEPRLCNECESQADCCRDYTLTIKMNMDTTWTKETVAVKGDYYENDDDVRYLKFRIGP